MGKRKDIGKEFYDKIVDLSGLESIIEVAENFSGIREMRDKYFELQRDL